MRALFIIIMITATALLAGCSTSGIILSQYHLSPGEKLKPEIIQPKIAGNDGITNEAAAILKNRLTSQLASSNLLASTNDGKIRILEVNVTNYRMRGEGVRFIFGILAGKDNIQSIVSIKDIANGQALMQFTVESNNSTSWGTSQGLIEDHANQIVEILNKAKDNTISTRESSGVPKTQPVVAAPAPVAPAAIAEPQPSAVPASPAMPARAVTENTPAMLPPQPAKSVSPLSRRAQQKPAERLGQDSYVARRLMQERACAPEPDINMVGKGAGYEVYTATCTNGDLMTIRCEFGNCRVLQ